MDPFELFDSMFGRGFLARSFPEFEEFSSQHQGIHRRHVGPNVTLSPPFDQRRHDERARDSLAAPRREQFGMPSVHDDFFGGGFGGFDRQFERMNQMIESMSSEAAMGAVDQGICSSFSSSFSSGGSGAGQGRAVSTSTVIKNGRAVTQTTTTTRHADGRIETNTSSNEGMPAQLSGRHDGRSMDVDHYSGRNRYF